MTGTVNGLFTHKYSGSYLNHLVIFYLISYITILYYIILYYIILYYIILYYEGVSKSPSTMLITHKSLVVHEFSAGVCCGCVL